ncbi:MAG: peptide-methionine (S)-S-oxide reductase MsrA [Patescibacteria group bacterium]
MKNKIVVFGSGCFWCSEAVFKQLRGVVAVTPGYAGGTVANPSYEQVCGGDTGHAEVVRVEYDPQVISFEDLLSVFFAMHDPTTINRQGNDVGEQYRSIILCTDEDQKQKSEAFIKDLEEQNLFDNPIVTAVEPLADFYEAEDYHKDYYKKNPDKAYCQAIIIPKLSKLRERFASLIDNSK